MAHTDTPAYRADYERGWLASKRAGQSSNPDYSPLESADLRGERDAWYDGYLDYAASREKWHLLNCPDHDNCGQG